MKSKDFVFLKQQLSKKDKNILIQGYPKSGNTWTVAFLVNYYRCLLDPKTNYPATFDEINNIYAGNYPELLVRRHTIEGFPVIWRTHLKYKRYHDLFDHVFYVYRNPLDTLISLYWMRYNYKIPFSDFPPNDRKKFIKDINYFVMTLIHDWIHHIKSSRYMADHVFLYEYLRLNPSLFRHMPRIIDGKVDIDALEKAIHLSSFDVMKKMSIEKDQQYGNKANKDTWFKGIFMRNGSVGQWKKQLKKETIEYVIDCCKKSGLQEEVSMYK